MVNVKKASRGGDGGKAEIIGCPGIAEGGNGGRGGALGCESGGSGGSAKVVTVQAISHAYARGGDGGDAARPARPALGAVSPMSYTDNPPEILQEISDIYGIPQPGKGGDSYVAFVNHEGYRYCLNILLQLIQGPMPNLINTPELIDIVDKMANDRKIKTEQEWWDLAVEKFPRETSKAMEHIRSAELG
ncbi:MULTISPECIES: hypothetical protein [Vibrio]|uniref:hypothetical protein n=1 Tax=Vibrio TaxID=662 RepID=UPI00102A097C|nr:hypothetical protein [Vibrio vulnificus]RZQ76309.1 hypothetical protein D8T30_06155 [Vibrio vulnificus]RZR01905.1 hypothetical protein D8T29_06025 [Vibrio vulnificus]